MPANKSYSEKDIMTELLISLKHMKSEYNIFTQEASGDEVYQKIDELYQEISCMQRDVYNLMSQKGWYKMQSEKATAIAKAYTKNANSEAELTK